VPAGDMGRACSTRGRSQWRVFVVTRRTVRNAQMHSDGSVEVFEC
jgi:hypothetical protein